MSADDGPYPRRGHGEDLRRTVSRIAPGYARPGDLEDPSKGLGAALTRYRVLAYVVGVGLATLCFVGVPLQFAAGIPEVDAVVGPVHGIYYMVYLLAAVDLSGCESRQPTRLSGGERQRVAIARALANEPAVVLADEPTGSLDTASAARVTGVFEQLRVDRPDLTIVMVTNDPRVAARADRIVEMSDGIVVGGHAATTRT